ncbi:MAG TPA: hypothetical protein VNL71_03190 [Chloroflexota bacterium]|nr:hypothetical protein [Chloroflexota bacterium]
MAISERAARSVLAPAVSKGTGDLASEPGCPKEVAEAYRQAFLATRFAMLHLPGTSLLVSAVDDSTTAAPLAANFALLAAMEGERVVLVDADPHTPTLGHLFSLTPALGFSELVRHEGADALGSLQPIDLGSSQPVDLRVLGAGNAGGIPGGVGRAIGLRELLLRLKNDADRVILVGTPILTHVDSMDLCSLVDGLVVTMSPGRTHREDAARARQVLDRVSAPLLGVVLTTPAMGSPAAR